tara:strand:+ start:177 stop:287 length:111 start_codon:yes stop_codon:yes gene_type:complete
MILNKVGVQKLAFIPFWAVLLEKLIRIDNESDRKNN